MEIQRRWRKYARKYEMRSGDTGQGYRNMETRRTKTRRYWDGYTEEKLGE